MLHCGFGAVHLSSSASHIHPSASPAHLFPLLDPACAVVAACKKQLKAEQADQEQLQQSSAAAKLDMTIEQAEQELAIVLKKVAAEDAR